MDQAYDLIGDIHGHADALSELLEHLGYNNSSGFYQHPKKKIIFLGDFIDRGPQQREVLAIVMAMVKNGSALAVMGNHEFNALAFHTPNPKKPGTWLRPRENKNLHQHLAFLSVYLGKEAKDELKEVLEFFYSLPLWIELDGLRVVHACWAPECIDYLKPLVNSDNTLTPQLLEAASNEEHPAYKAVETLLKGSEYTLPDNQFFHDKDGHQRFAARTRWWHNEDAVLHEVALPQGILNEETGSHTVKASDLIGYPKDQKPVFLGHYWLKGHPAKLSGNVACLDYSVAKDGKLVAYRWEGEQQIIDEHFEFVGKA